MYTDILKELQSNIEFTHGEQINNYSNGYICDVFSEIADSNVDIYTSDLFDWGKKNLFYIDDATREFGNPNDILKQLQQGQYYAYEQELYNNQENIIKYFAYSYLNRNNIKLTDSECEELDDYLSDVDSDDKLEDIIDYCKDLGQGYELV